jgi:REP element-mobilizing transposase RayT
MARLGRYFLPDQPLHLIQRGNNREAVFFCDEDYELYRAWLAEAAARHGCAIHAYVLMTNHVHLLATPQAPLSLPRMMQALGRRYVRHVNDAYRRTGTLWEGRYRAAPIDSERISSPAAATSSSTRCAPAWWRERPTIPGRAGARMRWVPPIRSSPSIRSIARWRRRRPRGRKRIARCSMRRSMRNS